MSNKVKVPGGAFYAGDGLTVDPVTRTVSAGGGDGGSVPKPLTFDYMPEGYPRKSVQATTLMEEQEVEFVFNSESGVYIGALLTGIEIAVGQTYRVNWDGTEYECVGEPAFNGNASILGNLSLAGLGVDTGEPFLYLYDNNETSGSFATLDTSASHTISVKTTEETVTPIAEEYLPKNLATKSEVEVTQSTANAAKATADNAQSTADTAKTTADTAKTTAENAVHREIISDSNTKYAYYDLGPGATDDSVQFVLTNIGWSYGSGLRIIVKDETNPSVTFTPPVYMANQANFAFARASDAYPHPKITEIGGIVMYSTTAGSTKKFSITVDDNGTISATEITKQEM